jgi:hypothetical protein
MESLLKPKNALVLANGTPLLVLTRIASGRPKSLKARSNTVNANFSLAIANASQQSRYRLAKSVMVNG